MRWPYSTACQEAVRLRADKRPFSRALEGEFDQDEGRRNLQLEAAAHVRVQTEIDRRATANSLPEPASVEFIKRLHLEFYRDAPKEMLRIRGNGTEFTMEPGAWRSKPDHDVAVGRHVPPVGSRVDDFTRYFAERYAFKNLKTAGRIMVMAAAGASTSNRSWSEKQRIPTSLITNWIGSAP